MEPGAITQIFNSVTGYLPSWTTALKATGIAALAYVFAASSSFVASFFYNRKLELEDYNSGEKPPHKWGWTFTPEGTGHAWKSSITGKRKPGTAGPGIKMHGPGLAIISKLFKDHAASVNTLPRQSEIMLEDLLTSEGIAIDVPLNIHWRVTEPSDFVFSAQSQEDAEKILVATCSRQVRCKISTMDRKDIQMQLTSGEAASIIDLEALNETVRKAGITVSEVITTAPLLEPELKKAMSLQYIHDTMMNEVFEKAKQKALETGISPEEAVETAREEAGSFKRMVTLATTGATPLIDMDAPGSRHKRGRGPESPSGTNGPS